MGDTEYIQRFDHFSGFSGDRGAFAGYRYESEAGFRAGEVESYVFSFAGDEVASRTWNHAPLSGLYYTDSDRIYVASSDGTVDQHKDIEKGAIRSDKLGLAMPALFALDDQHVYAYGGAPGKGRVFFFDGKKWSELPPPPAWLIHMHGCAPDCIYAAAQGAVYLWNGKTWRQVLGAEQVFASVWVVSPDEVYAAGRSGLLFDGSADGFVERARWEGPLVGVAKWKGDLWLGGEDAGLLKLSAKARKIKVVKPNIKARYLDARESLLMVDEEDAVVSEDGKAFLGTLGTEGFEEITHNRLFLS